MKKWITSIAAAVLCAALSACGSENGHREQEGNASDGAELTTLVYGSGDYTRINPAMDEHGEFNILLFTFLTAHNGDT